MKSKTTRRSTPMIRSRLRKPTSKSMTTVLCPRWAKPVAKAADVVVLPTPPLPDVMVMTLANQPSSEITPHTWRPRYGCDRRNDRFAFLGRPNPVDHAHKHAINQTIAGRITFSHNLY